jgi:hypothetical protein
MFLAGFLFVLLLWTITDIVAVFERDVGGESTARNISIVNQQHLLSSLQKEHGKFASFIIKDVKVC